VLKVEASHLAERRSGHHAAVDVAVGLVDHHHDHDQGHGHTHGVIDPTIATFQNAIALTDASFHGGVVKDLICAVDACGALQKVLDEKCGPDGPSLYQFYEVLNAIKQLMTQSLHARQDEPEPITEEFEPAAAEGPAEIEVWSSGPIRSRADAYRRLAEAADYLMRTEPHSPTGYLVQRAVEWGHMSLFDVMKQIVRNDNEMEEIDRLLRLSGNASDAG